MTQPLLFEQIAFRSGMGQIMHVVSQTISVTIILRKLMGIRDEKNHRCFGNPRFGRMHQSI